MRLTDRLMDGLTDRWTCAILELLLQQKKSDILLYSLGWMSNALEQAERLTSHTRAKKVLHNFAWNLIYDKVLQTFAWNPLYNLLRPSETRLGKRWDKVRDQ